MRHGAGTPIEEASLEAARRRFRPILMTAFAVILGVVPLVLASRAGAQNGMGTAVVWGMLVTTALSIVRDDSGVTSYLEVWTAGNGGDPRLGSGPPTAAVHPGERWRLLANRVGLGSAHLLEARSASFVLVLALHHEVQHLCYTYAMARRAQAASARGAAAELSRLTRFSVWPLIGRAVWAASAHWSAGVLGPFPTAGFLAHYWLDGRIWTARARRLASLPIHAR